MGYRAHDNLRQVLEIDVVGEAVWRACIGKEPDKVTTSSSSSAFTGFQDEFIRATIATLIRQRRSAGSSGSFPSSFTHRCRFLM